MTLQIGFARPNGPGGPGARFFNRSGIGRVGLFGSCRHGEQLTRACDVGGAVAIGKQSVVADAVEALGQDVDEEAPDELVGWQRHGRVPTWSFDPVILSLERDAVIVG